MQLDTLMRGISVQTSLDEGIPSPLRPLVLPATILEASEKDRSYQGYGILNLPGWSYLAVS